MFVEIPPVCSLSDDRLQAILTAAMIDPECADLSREELLALVGHAIRSRGTPLPDRVAMSYRLSPPKPDAVANVFPFRKKCN
ncbi:hypothetical protein [Noviherbaspirillum pedocola]|uniref:Uncharacterized protein n=1 Tax=Noviherbaspirillum pedocola TaxID=2801341 RepID=A0A934W7B9_9BURK|nr:hypothetical protein [Noviherbaspirillum pedocola]MBK4736180.1 hypothetical protein [Noviherbaspirillum pedocola]